jgi:hypothetical protein
MKKLKKLTKTTVSVGAAPTKYPDWAMTDIIEPISGSNNVIEPPDEFKQSGFLYAGVIQRNWINWLFRYISLWIRFLNGALHTPYSYSNTGKPIASDFTPGKMIFISDLGVGGSMAFSDGTNWRKVSDNSII